MAAVAPPIGERLPSWKRLLEAWRARRLRLSGLPRDAQVVGACVLSGSLLIAVLIILLGTGHVPGSAEATRGIDPIPRVVVVFTYIGLALAAVAAVFAAMRRSFWSRRLLLLGAGGLGAAAGAETVVATRTVHRIGFGDFVLYPGLPTGVLLTLGWIGFAFGVAVALLPNRALTMRRRAWLAVPAVAPFALGLIAYAVAVTVKINHTPLGRALIIRDPTTPRTAGGFLEDSGVGVALSLGTSVFVLFIWQLIEASRGIRDTGSVARRWSRRLPALVLAALAAKLVWVALGYADVLPGWLSGGSRLWSSSLHDGALSWLIAVGFAAAAGFWLSGPRRHALSEDQLERGVQVIVAGLALFSVASTLLVILHSILLVLPGKPLAGRTVTAESWLIDHVSWSYVGTVYAALAVGALVALRRSARTLALMLLLFGIWALPRAIDHTIALLRHTSALAAAVGSPSVPGTGSVNLVTLDTAISVVLLVVVVASLRRRAHANPGALALVLVASTFSAHSGFLSNIFGSSAIVFYLGLVFPALYEFLADSQELNESGSARPARLLVLAAFASALLTGALALVAFGELGTNTPSDATFGQILFGPPLLALLVALTLAGRTGASPDTVPVE